VKLAFALHHFGVAVEGLTAADLGCHQGGFTDCLLQEGAARVHAVDTAYGVLHWNLRNDPRVVVHERTNLLHWKAPEPVGLIVIDAGWTPVLKSVRAGLASLAPGGVVLGLVKPQYEAGRGDTSRGVLPADRLASVMEGVRARIATVARIRGEVTSPVPGSGGNTEVWMHLAAEDH